MIKSIIAQLKLLFKKTDAPNPTALEKYIISRNPQSIFEVECLTKEFDLKQIASYGYWY